MNRLHYIYGGIILVLIVISFFVFKRKEGQINAFQTKANELERSIIEQEYEFNQTLRSQKQNLNNLDSLNKSFYKILFKDVENIGRDSLQLEALKSLQ